MHLELEVGGVGGVFAAVFLLLIPKKHMPWAWVPVPLEKGSLLEQPRKHVT